MDSQRIYTGRVLNLDVDTVRFPDGSEGKLEMIRHPGASAVVPFLSDPKGDDPQILLLYQFRHAAGGSVYEIPAGRLNSGEEPLHCAKRELLEETGCTAEHFEHLTTILTTPGFTDERIHLFSAWSLTQGESEHERDEFIELKPLRLSEILLMIREGKITDSKTIVALLYVAGFRLGR